jgi:hypothetical protein
VSTNVDASEEHNESHREMIRNAAAATLYEIAVLMSLRQKEDIDDYGAPISFLRGEQVCVRQGLSRVFLDTPRIPLDGRVYICGGEIILNNGDRIPAHFELDTSRSRPFIKDSVWCTPDHGKVWYRLDKREDVRELLEILSLTRADMFPIRWRPGRPLLHEDPGPYPVDWRITFTA